MLGGLIYSGSMFAASFSESMTTLTLTYGLAAGIGYWLIMAPSLSIVK